MRARRRRARAARCLVVASRAREPARFRSGWDPPGTAKVPQTATAAHGGARNASQLNAAEALIPVRPQSPNATRAATSSPKRSASWLAAIGGATWLIFESERDTAFGPPAAGGCLMLAGPGRRSLRARPVALRRDRWGQLLETSARFRKCCRNMLEVSRIRVGNGSGWLWLQAESCLIYLGEWRFTADLLDRKRPRAHGRARRNT